MLSRELMGIAALAILWINTFLVLGAAALELASVLRRWRKLGPVRPGGKVGLLQGRVASGAGPGGALAAHHIEQVGRQAADDRDRRAIAFSDRSYRCELFGGEVDAPPGLVLVAKDPERSGAADGLAPSRWVECEFWPAPAAVRAAAECPSRSTFDRAHADARKARGFLRTVSTEIAAGAPVWVVGSLTASEGGAAMHAPLLVAAFDPRSFCRRAAAILVGFMMAAALLAAVCTFVALYPPHFGTVSTIGGALCLAYFLLIQPAGTAVRDRVRLPHRALLRGSWIETRTAASAPIEHRAA